METNQLKVPLGENNKHYLSIIQTSWLERDEYEVALCQKDPYGLFGITIIPVLVWFRDYDEDEPIAKYPVDEQVLRLSHLGEFVVTNLKRAMYQASRYAWRNEL